MNVTSIKEINTILVQNLTKYTFITEKKSYIHFEEMKHLCIWFTRCISYLKSYEVNLEFTVK